MQVRSLGYRTDLIFNAFEGEISEREDYLVVRTPANPTYYWGNYLLMARAPTGGDLDGWTGLFRREVVGSEHLAFGFDEIGDDPGEVEPFIQDGYILNRSDVLTATSIRPPRHAVDSVEVRTLSTNDEWAQALENQVICREPEFDEVGYREYRAPKLESYRRMQAQGLGGWFGAFVDSQLVADCGLFHEGPLARYQSVQTHPEFRRRGIGGALVHYAGRYAFENFGVDRLVIVARVEGPAGRLYRSLGFDFTEHRYGLEKRPES